jgi:hypothetical protein
MPRTALSLTRERILAFRRAAQALDSRLPRTSVSLRRVAWAGLQDSMPRAALLSIHARVRGATAAAWEAPSLVQVWGPRYSTYVVDARDAAIFTLARLPDSGPTRRVAESLADRLGAVLGGERMSERAAARALGEPPNRLRYATLTGRVRLRWDGAREPTLWMAPAPRIAPAAARAELCRRYLHVFGPATPESFAAWAGIPPATAPAVVAALAADLLPVRTPTGEAWLLASDEALARGSVGAPAPARLLPSGDTWFLHHRAEERALLVEAARDRARLWTSRVWPGALLVNGVIAGTWRRAASTVTIEPWRRLSAAERDAVEREVEALPLPGAVACRSQWAG